MLEAEERQLVNEGHGVGEDVEMADEGDVQLEPAVDAEMTFMQQQASEIE